MSTHDIIDNRNEKLVDTALKIPVNLTMRSDKIQRDGLIPVPSKPKRGEKY
jgi:hypothetical protein